MNRLAFLCLFLIMGGTFKGEVYGAPKSSPPKTAAVERALDRASAGDLKPMQTLLDHGLSPRTHLNGSPLLHFTAAFRGEKFARLLLGRGARLDDRDADQNDALCIAAMLGNAPVARLLLAQGADANSHNKDGDTPLHLAALVGAITAPTGNGSDIARVLIASHALVNSRNNRGETPLHLAMGAQNFALAKVLLQAGADPNTRDKSGATPSQIGETWETMVLVSITSDKRKPTTAESVALREWQGIKPLLESQNTAAIRGKTGSNASKNER